MKRMLAGYFAFAPHIAFAACVTLFRLGFCCEQTMWLLALPVCLVCVPLSLVWAIMNIRNARSEKIGLISATLAIEGHFSFYIHLSAIANADSLPNTFPFMMTVMGSLIASGASLLLLWDNDMKGSQ